MSAITTNRTGRHTHMRPVVRPMPRPSSAIGDTFTC
jgi:hypothetical protein